MTFLHFVISLVIIFDFINVFHDAANSIACIVSTNVLPALGSELGSYPENFYGVDIHNPGIRINWRFDLSFFQQV